MAWSAFSGLNLDEKKAQKGLGFTGGRPPEGEESAALRVGFHVADDDVIQQFDLKNLGRFAQRAGNVDIR